MTRFTRFLILMLYALTGFAITPQAQVANFTGTPLAGCAPLLVQYTNTSTGTITSYAWDLGNSATSALQNPSTTYTTPGTYNVKLTVSGPGGTNTKTVNAYITVYSQPTVSFTASTLAGCPPFTTQFNNTSTPNAPGGMTYNWDFGDGNTSTLQNPAHTYGVPGFYSITLVVTNSFGCSKTVVNQSYLQVYAPPIGNFTASNFNPCVPPATVNFTNTSTGSGPFTAAWNFGDATTGAGNNPSHTYAGAGTYIVTMVVTDAHGCKDTVNNVVNVGAHPTFTVPATACVNELVTFTNTTANSSNPTWDFGDGGTATGNIGTHNYLTAGTYNVRLIVSQGPCQDTVIVPITILPKPVSNFTATPLIPCPAPSTVQFTSTSTNAVSYQWYFGDGGTSTQANPSHTYNSNGMDTVTLIVTNANGCKDTITKNAYIKLFNMLPQMIASPDHGCIPFPVHFHGFILADTPYNYGPSTPYPYPVPVVSWFWNFGDGFTSTQDTPTHVYTVYGTYTATLTMTTANGCVTTVTQVIHAGTKPVASFYVTPAVQCAHRQVLFTSTSTGGATSYVWNFGNGDFTISNSTVTPYAYDTPGVFTVTLIAFNNGCDDDTTMINVVTINPPSASFVDSVYCPPSKTVYFRNTSVGTTSQKWYFGDGDTSTQVSPTHTYPAFGTYICMLVTYNSAYGCTDTARHQFQLINPQVSFVANDTTVCRDDTIHLTGTYVGLPQYYFWRLDNQFLIDTLPVIDYTWHTTGYHTVTFIVKNIYGCWDSLRKTNYVLMAKPVAAFTGVPVLGCTPMNVNFTDQSVYTVSTSAANRSWTYGTGGTASNNSVTSSYTYATAGTYDVQLIVTDNIGCKDTLFKPAYITAHKPAANFTADDSTACPGQVITFYNYSTTQAPITYSWTFGDGGTSTLGQPTHVYNQTGVYTVRLIVTDTTGCVDTMTKIGYVDISKPDASFLMSDTIAICPPLLVHFTNTSTSAVNYIWNFGNGSPSTLTNPVNTYATPGSFNVTLIAVNPNGCTDTAFGHVTVLGYAGSLVYSPVSGCAPLTVNFTAAITNVPNLVWDFSDGVTIPATGLTISHTYLTPGAYLPKLIFSDGLGCINSSTGIDTIKVDGVVPGFKVDFPCEKTNAKFIDTSHAFFSTINAWSWDFGSGPSAFTTPAYHYYPSPGTYPVTLIVTNGNGCKDTITQNVVIHTLPDIHADGDTAICVGDYAPLLGSGGVSYTWTPVTNLSCTNCSNPNATPTTQTLYFVTGRDANGCDNKDSVVVKIQTKTSSDVSGDKDICEGHSVQLVAYGAQIYQWSPASSLDNSQIPNPVASPAVKTKYMVIAREGTCPPDTNYVQVDVHPKPNVNAGADQTIVAGNNVVLQASGTGVDHYEWLPEASLSCTICTNPTAAPKRTTTYYITGTSDYGCSDTDDVVIHVVCDQSQVFIPNTFTPNGDGQNDYFFPRGVGLDKVTSFRIYSRWGELLFERTGMDLNDEKSGWDGMYKGKLLPPDVFVYVVEAICANGEPIKWKGDITIMR